MPLPFPHYRINHEVEDHWGEGAALCDTAARLEEAAVVARRPATQQALFPEPRDQADRLLANPYVAKDLETSVSIHHVVGLPQVHENTEEGGLFQAAELLRQLNLHDCGAASASRPEAV